MKNFFKLTAFLGIFWLLVVSFANYQKKITIYSIGDSTMAEYDIPKLSKEYGGESYPLRGWMMKMPEFFNKNAIIKNVAKSGRSSKSFRVEGRWDEVLKTLKAGDYVFIQFGHNDEKPDTARYADPPAFRQNLYNYIQETRQKGAHPVLFTSIVRREFDSAQTLVDTHGEYITVVKDLAAETNTPLVDLNEKTRKLVQDMGADESKKLYLYIAPGLFSKLPSGLKDDTHVNEYGASRIAELAVEGIKELHLPLVKYLK